jgi:GNAT superfamily N-acetyltransferase
MSEHIEVRRVTMPSIPESEGNKYNAAYAWWYVELHLAATGWYGPVAMAVVSQCPLGAYVESLFVQDQFRRQGCATLLMEAIGKRFPRVEWEDNGISRPFHESLVRSGIAQPTGDNSYLFN